MYSLKRIGYVEDEKTLQQIAKMSLERVGGFEVFTYSSGADALAGLPKNLPDLLLLDVNMPVMTGTELYAELKKASGLSHIPVIFMTGKQGKDDIKQLRDLGALAVLTKPIDVMKLSDKLREIWQGR